MIYYVQIKTRYNFHVGKITLFLENMMARIVRIATYYVMDMYNIYIYKTFTETKGILGKHK